MTALSIIQTVMAWQGLTPIPTGNIFTSTDPQIIEMRSLMNEELVELRKWPSMYWRKLLRQHTFTTTATQVQPANALPDDFDYMVPNSGWDRTLTRPVVGPISPQEWQAWEARPILTSIVWGFRLRGNDFLTAPIPPAGDLVAYEYVSTLAVYAYGDTAPTKVAFTEDNDTCVFDETMVARGVRWRFLSQKGLPFETEFKLWESLVQREAARTKQMGRINASGPIWTGLAGPYVPSFNWPGM